MYDIIGDVHGHASLLKELLLKMGYVKAPEGYIHSDRKAVFVGDFINRGPQIRKCLRIIRKMVENGSALAILGNHEINTIIAHLEDEKGKPLMKPPMKNFLPVIKTIQEFAIYPDEWKDHLNWMRTLPLFLDLGDVRVAHACWSDTTINYLKEHLPPGRIKKNVFRKMLKSNGSELAQAIWITTKGLIYKMPGDLKVINNKGVSPRSFRIRWWEEPSDKTFEAISFESKFKLPEYTIPPEIAPATLPYPEDAPILFFGHYCRANGPHIIKPNLCCVDSCVAGSKSLLAYRWNGEKVLLPDNLIQVKK